MQALDRHLAQILADYLATDDAVTAGLPSVASCPRIVSDDMTHDQVSPQITVSPQIDEDPSLPTVTLTVAIHGIISASLTTTQLSTWQEAIRVLLLDRAAFYTHLATLDLEDYRTGYRISKYGPVLLQRMETGPEEHSQSFPVVLRIKALIINNGAVVEPED